jgi:hypothetical protein
MKFVGFTEQSEASHDGNVFEAQPGLDAVSGGWRRHGGRALTVAVGLGLGVPAAAATAWAAWHRRQRR